MTDEKPVESAGFWSVFHILSVDRKNRSVTPYGKLPRIGLNTGNAFAACPGYVVVGKQTGYTLTTGYFFLKGIAVVICWVAGTPIVRVGPEIRRRGRVLIKPGIPIGIWNCKIWNLTWKIWKIGSKNSKFFC